MPSLRNKVLTLSRTATSLQCGQDLELVKRSPLNTLAVVFLTQGQGLVNSLRLRQLCSETIKLTHHVREFAVALRSFQEFHVCHLSERFVVLQNCCKRTTNCLLFIPCYYTSVLLCPMVQVHYTTWCRFLQYTQLRHCSPQFCISRRDPLHCITYSYCLPDVSHMFYSVHCRKDTF